MLNPLPISVIIPTFKRVSDLEYSLNRIYNCKPFVEEIIVHIDAGDNETEKMLSAKFKQVIILKSDNKIGPGGGRNKCILKASNNLIASFDDDSFPIDEDYFLELFETSQQYPEAVVIESKIYHLNEEIQVREKKLYEQYNFTGCGCAYHKNHFVKTEGYVPKPIAYGLEEVDLALKVFEQNSPIIHNTQLRVLHNTQLKHHSSSKINAAAITNQALLTYLRYPITLYIKGFMQIGNRIWWSIKNKRLNGVLKGMCDIPFAIFKYRHYRKTLPASIIRDYLIKRTQRKLILINNES